jgi:hypothetical protein
MLISSSLTYFFQSKYANLAELYANLAEFDDNLLTLSVLLGCNRAMLAKRATKISQVGKPTTSGYFSYF